MAGLRHDDGWYRIDRERLTPREVVEQLGRLSERFPVVAVEDGLADEDWAVTGRPCASGWPDAPGWWRTS